uniref:Uncharacterized protein n=1 Tax=Catharus ustulatus TaxID=91951 RepID=A0A8C3U3P1_CATUS
LTHGTQHSFPPRASLRSQNQLSWKRPWRSSSLTCTIYIPLTCRKFQAVAIDWGPELFHQDNAVVVQGSLYHGRHKDMESTLGNSLLHSSCLNHIPKSPLAPNSRPNHHFVSYSVSGHPNIFGSAPSF